MAFPGTRMGGAEELTVKAIVERKHESLPRFLVVPADVLSGWKLDGTTVVEGMINGVAMGRRSLKQWDAARWFIDLPEAFCRKAGIETGDRVEVLLAPASTGLPAELSRLMDEDKRARAEWREMTPSRRRMIREHVLQAKRPDTRARRARKALLGDE